MTKKTDRRRAPKADAANTPRTPLWRWGAGAGVAASALAAAAYNLKRTRAAERAHPATGKFVTVDGVKLHYIERGTGPLVVLLHGNGTTSQDWFASGVGDKLAQTQRVIAFDRPGFGYSERPRTRIWTPAAQAKLIAQALREMGEGPATVVGHSFGTLVALSLALDHQEAVSSLVLLGGYFYPTVRADVPFVAPPAIPLIGDAMRYTVSPFIGSALKSHMESKIFAPAPVASGWLEDFPFELTLRPSQIRAEAAEAGIMVPAAAAFAPRAGELALPVTIIAGSGDEIVDTETQSERLAEAVPGSKLVLIEGAGHMSHYTAPDRVSDAIRAAAQA